jgi:hypothetical protein
MGGVPMRAVLGIAVLTAFCSFPNLVTSAVNQPLRPTRMTSPADSGQQTDEGAQTRLAGPVERNRFWRVYNNRCLPPEGLTPTTLETNLCLMVHRETTPATKRQALLACRRIGAIQFYDWQTDMLVEALGRARPDYFIRAVRLVAKPNRLGRFVLELVADRSRVVLVLTNRQVPLE